MIDVSKFKVGDEVTVRLIVVSEELSCNGVQCKSGIGSWHYSIEQGDIVGHTPKPREIKVGDKVIRPTSSRHIWEVMAISGQRAWLTSGVVDVVVQVSTLTHAP